LKNLFSLPAAGSLLRVWENFSRFPGGKFAFSIFIGRIAPYSGSIRPRVLEMSRGHALVEMRYRRGVGNPFNSIHAVALANLAELAGGLDMLSALPEDARAIITGLSVEYKKKARGKIRALCNCEPPFDNREKEYEVKSELRDESGETVAEATARWLVRPAGDDGSNA